MSRPRLVVWAVAAAALALTAFAGLTPANAALQPGLTVSGVEAAPGILRFLLTARDLPAGAELDPGKVDVSVGSTPLVVDVTRVSRTAGELPRRGLVVVVDVSGSVAGARLATAQAAARALAADLPTDVLLGLVTVESTPALVVRPTTDRAAFVGAVDKVQAGGQTALWDGVAMAQSSLAAAEFGAGSDQRVLVLSDGLDTASETDLGKLQRDLAESAVPVDTVAFQAPVEGVTELRALSEATHGRLINAADASDAADGFRATGRSFSVVLAVAATVPNAYASTNSVMVVTVRGTELVTRVPVVFGEAVDVPSAPRSYFGWVPVWVTYVIGAVVFVGLLVLVLGVAWPRSHKRDRIAQIAHFGPARSAPPKPREQESAGGVVVRTALAATASIVRSGGLEERIGLRLEQAGMKIKPHEWVLLRVCVMVTFGALLFLVADWVGVIAGLLLGWLVTMLYRLVRVDRRSQQFAEQLPDALQLVIGSLKSGFSLPQAFDSLVRESTGPVGVEFGRAMAEHRLGADVSDALERTVRRTGSTDLGWAVIAVRIQREVGGNLAEVLQNAVDTMRERGRLRRHVRALSAEGRLSAWILIALPILLGAFMFIFRRRYLTPLFTDPLGVTMLLVGALLFVVGIIWMTRVVKVEA